MPRPIRDLASRPRLLDLFCCAGGASVGYARAGFDVVGVDIDEQPRYPFSFRRADALEVLADLDYVRTFDAVHASPPCQAYTTLKARNRHIEHPELVEPVRELLVASGLPFVIENTPGAPLRDPITLCGSMFSGLGVKRHRIFESNVHLAPPGPCDHSRGEPRYLVRNHGRDYLTRWCPVYGTGGKKAAEQWAEAMGIDWASRAEIAEAIPPAYTEHLGRQLLAAIGARV
jgi:DNA (cytosine-5)-methyltransferase 1